MWVKTTLRFLFIAHFIKNYHLYKIIDPSSVLLNLITGAKDEEEEKEKLNKDKNCQESFILNKFQLPSQNIFSMQPQTYPQDYSCIVSPQGSKGGIYIGNLQAAQSVRTLQKHDIKAVLTAARGITLNHPKHLIPHSLYIAANDHESFDLSIFFDQAADFISQILTQTNIMVHCLAGVSRSVSLVIAYFIKYRQMTFTEAFQLIKSRRKIIHPNDGFIKQLKTYEDRLGHQMRNRSMSPQLHPSSPQKKNQRSHYQSTQQFQLRKPLERFSPKKYLKAEENQESVESKLQNQMTYNHSQLYKQRASPSFFSPKKQENQQFKGRIKKLSSTNSTTLSSNYPIQDKNQLNSTLTSSYSNQVDITDIDRKIQEIRKKYQQYTNNPILTMNRYGVYDGDTSKYNKSVWVRPADEPKKRQYSYLNQFQRDIRRPSASYNYTNY